MLGLGRFHPEARGVAPSSYLAQHRGWGWPKVGLPRPDRRVSSTDDLYPQRDLGLWEVVIEILDVPFAEIVFNEGGQACAGDLRGSE